MASNTQQTGAASAEREQKMLESSVENLLQRLSSLRNSLTTLVAKVESGMYLQSTDKGTKMKYSESYIFFTFCFCSYKMVSENLTSLVLTRGK